MIHKRRIVALAFALLLLVCVPLWGDEYYKVKRGDTLWSIAEKFETSVYDLVELNNISDPDSITIGTELIVSRDDFKIVLSKSRRSLKIFLNSDKVLEWENLHILSNSLSDGVFRTLEEVTIPLETNSHYDEVLFTIASSRGGKHEVRLSERPIRYLTSKASYLAKRGYVKIPPATHLVVRKNVTEEITYLQDGTNYRAPVYTLESDLSGPTILIIGGIHGDEPAGIEAASRLTYSNIDKGKLIIVPRANILACRFRVREYKNEGNLNRIFPGRADGTPLEKLAFSIFSLIEKEKPDVIIDMQESRDFYRNDPQNRYGQTIVVDRDWISEEGRSIVLEVNSKIRTPLEKYTFLLKPIEGALTFASTRQLGIPAFVVETSKKLDFEKRVDQQMMIAQIIAKKFGVVIFE